MFDPQRGFRTSTKMSAIGMTTVAMAMDNFTTSPPPEDVSTSTAGHLVHLMFLIFVCVFGTIGNVMTMVAVKVEKKLRSGACNYLVLNLAVADCVVCAVVVPVILTNMLVAGSWFSKVLCYVSVGLSGVACHTAAVTMTFIALNRYVAANYCTMYRKLYTKQRVLVTILTCWTFAVANTVPVVLAWTEVDIDSNKYVCICFDGTFPLKFILFAVFVGHLVPHSITIYCYARILKALSESRRRVERKGTVQTASTAFYSKDKNKSKTASNQYICEEHCKKSRSMMGVKNWGRHEIQMLKSSIWIIVFFSFCWIPYGILVLLRDLAPIELKEVFGALCLLTFSLNPIIYGVLSKRFCQAYKKLFDKIFCRNGRQALKQSSMFAIEPVRT